MTSSIPSIFAVLTTVIGLSLAMYSTLLWIRQCFDEDIKMLFKKTWLKFIITICIILYTISLIFFDIKLL